MESCPGKSINQSHILAEFQKSIFRPEALLFLILYILYCVAMAFNSNFERWAKAKLPVPQSWKDAVEQQEQMRKDGTNYKSIHKVANGGNHFRICLFQHNIY